MADSLKLIGVNKKGTFNLNSYNLTGIKSIQAYIGGSLKSFDSSLPKNLWNNVQPFISLEGGRGYWIVFKDDKNNEINFTGKEISLNDVKIEKNSKLSLVAFPSNMGMKIIINFFNEHNCSVKSIQAYIGGSLKSFDPSLPKNLWNNGQPFTKTTEGLGYWVLFKGTCTISAQSSNSSTNNIEFPPSVGTNNSNNNIVYPPQAGIK